MGRWAKQPTGNLKHYEEDRKPNARNLWGIG